MPAHARRIVGCWATPGLPPGVVNFVTTAPDAGAVVEALIAHPAVRRINFTGSTAGGAARRRDRRRAPQARAARAGRQGAAGRAGRRRPRRGGGRRGLRRVRHRGRSACRPSGSSSTSRSPTTFVASSRPRRAACRSATRASPDGDRPALGRPRSSAWSALDRRRASTRAPSWSCGGEAEGTLHAGRPCSTASRPRCGSTARSPSGRWWRGARDGVEEAVAGGQRHRVRTLRRGVRRATCRARWTGAPDRGRHLPRQRPHGARRAADAVRRREGERLSAASAARPRSTSSRSCAG